MPSPVNEHASLVTSQLALLRQLEWRVRHAVENVLSGEYRSAFRGRGMEFDQVVKYAFGDDIRDIDWNVTARLGEPYRKKFIEEREVTLLLVFEDSVSLQFGSGAQSKREALLELAGLVMMLGAVNRDRVGFLHASPAGYHPAGTRARPRPDPACRRHAPRPAGARARDPASGIAGQLHPLAPAGAGRAAPQHPDLARRFSAARRTRGLDACCTRRYQTMGFRVDDPWERELPDERVLAAYDPGRRPAGHPRRRLLRPARPRTPHGARSAMPPSAPSFPTRSSRLVVRTDEERLDALVRFFHARMRCGARPSQADAMLQLNLHTALRTIPGWLLALLVAARSVSCGCADGARRAGAGGAVRRRLAPAVAHSDFALAGRSWPSSASSCSSSRWPARRSSRTSAR